MNKFLKILTTIVVAAVVTACGGGDEHAGTPPFGNGTTGCSASAASGAAGTCATAANLTLALDTASIQNTGAATVKATATDASGAPPRLEFSATDRLPLATTSRRRFAR